MSRGLAIVTGSSRGIGRAIAEALARGGFDVAVTYHRRAEEAGSVVQSLEALGVSASAHQLNVASTSSVRQLFADVGGEFGPLRVLVNNAGILNQKSFEELSEDDWDETLGVNLRGTFFCCQEAFPCFRKYGSGRIINVASSGAQLGGVLAVHYAASKAGVISLTKSLARIGAPDILVNCVSPGLIETEMTASEISSAEGRSKIEGIPLGRVGLAEEVATAVAFLASNSASYVTGQTINVNGGLYLG